MRTLGDCHAVALLLVAVARSLLQRDVIAT